MQGKLKYFKQALLIVLAALLLHSCINSDDTEEKGIIGSWVFSLDSTADSRQQTLEFSGEEAAGLVSIDNLEVGTFTVTEDDNGESTLIIKLQKEDLYSYKLWGSFLPVELESGTLTGYYHIIKDEVTSSNYKWEAEREF